MRKHILKEQAKYYSKLYSQNPEVHFAYKNDGDVKYSEEDKKLIDQEFTYEEFTKALKNYG